MNEQDYIRGSNAAYRNMLALCFKQLSITERADALVFYARFVKERGEIIEALRIICEEFGDNDWPDNLYVPDIIEKHLHRNLSDRAGDDGLSRTLNQTFIAVKEYIEKTEAQKNGAMPDLYLDVISFITEEEGVRSGGEDNC